MNRKYSCKIVFLLLIAALFTFAACTNLASASSKRVRHQAELVKNGSVLYVDKVENNKVMRENAGAHFCSFRVGFRDSISINAKMENEKNIYYNYRVSNDWKAVINGDSLAPVFYQPLTSLNILVKEGILVFELLPGDKQPDTLLYSDSFGNWQQQVIVLSKH